MDSNIKAVTDFIAAWPSLDAQLISDYFTRDAVYHNVPMEPVIGRDNISAFIAEFLVEWIDTQWQIKNIVANDDIVMAERIDNINTAQGNVALPCVGVFEMQGGKIKVWRDYFDMATYANAMQP